MPKDFGTAGPRAIYPDATHSTSLAACSDGAERLFWRIVSQADDQGRLEGDAHTIGSLCVPRLHAMTDRRVTALLGELNTNGLIRLYAAAGAGHLIQLVTWWRWQAGMRRAYPSKWPPPAGWTDAVYGLGPPGPTTYRQARGIDPYERPKFTDGSQPADLNHTESPQDVGPRAQANRTHAQPLPVPSAGAGAGANGYDESSESVPLGIRAGDAGAQEPKGGRR